MIDDIERGSLTIAHDSDESAAGSVGPHHVRLHPVAIPHVRDVLQVNGGAIHSFNGKVVHFAEHLGTAVQPHLVIAVADLDVPGGQDYILEIDGI